MPVPADLARGQAKTPAPALDLETQELKAPREMDHPRFPRIHHKVEQHAHAELLPLDIIEVVSVDVEGAVHPIPPPAVTDLDCKWPSSQEAGHISHQPQVKDFYEKLITSGKSRCRLLSG